MKLTKCENLIPGAETAAFGEATLVQGARRRSAGNLLHIDSPRRFKLYARGRDSVRILAGSGHFKWARGETPFAAGESFLVEGEGEYELNGRCVFVVLQE